MAKKKKGGKKYKLLLYQHMLNRWWPLLLTLAIILYTVIGVFWGAEWYFINPAENPLPRIPIDQGVAMIFIASISLMLAMALMVMRNMAYVQIFPGYLRIVTPFMRFNISFKRITRIHGAEVQALFPSSKMSNYQKDMLDEILGMTASVVELKSYPVKRSTMSFFLSPYFFYDKSTHFVLIIDDWMRFNTELESARSYQKIASMPSAQQQPFSPYGMSSTNQSQAPAKKKKSSSFLDSLNKD